MHSAKLQPDQLNWEKIKMDAGDFDMLLERLLRGDVPDSEQLYRELEEMYGKRKLTKKQYEEAKREYEVNRGDSGNPDL